MPQGISESHDLRGVQAALQHTGAERRAQRLRGRHQNNQLDPEGDRPQRGLVSPGLHQGFLQGGRARPTGGHARLGRLAHYKHAPGAHTCLHFEEALQEHDGAEDSHERAAAQYQKVFVTAQLALVEVVHQSQAAAISRQTRGTKFKFQSLKSLDLDLFFFLFKGRNKGARGRVQQAEGGV